MGPFKSSTCSTLATLNLCNADVTWFRKKSKIPQKSIYSFYKTLLFTGPKPHNPMVTVRHHRPCWPIDPNARRQLVPLSLRTRPVHSYKGRTHISEQSTGFLLYRRALRVSHQIPAVTAHSNDLTPHSSNQRLCEMTQRGACWPLMQSAGAAVWRMLLSQRREWQAKGSPLCLSHGPVWPVRA